MKSYALEAYETRGWFHRCLYFGLAIALNMHFPTNPLGNQLQVPILLDQIYMSNRNKL